MKGLPGGRAGVRVRWPAEQIDMRRRRQCPDEVLSGRPQRLPHDECLVALLEQAADRAGLAETAERCELWPRPASRPTAIPARPNAPAQRRDGTIEAGCLGGSRPHDRLPAIGYDSHRRRCTNQINYGRLNEKTQAWDCRISQRRRRVGRWAAYLSGENPCD